MHHLFHFRENRYLLFLTENDAALEIMQNYLFQHDVKPYVLFGSSFPKDKDYTQVKFIVTLYYYITLTFVVPQVATYISTIR